jgi:hypothetical protein
MKKILAALAFVLFSSAAFSTNNNGEKREEVCLEVTGLAVNHLNVPLDSVSVRLYKGSEEIDWMDLTAVPHHEHRFKYSFQTNEYYTIEVSRPGYISRRIAVSTELPEELELDPIFHFTFDVELIPESEKLNEFYTDFPIAIISYDKKTQVFNISQGYTRHIKNKLQQP